MNNTDIETKLKEFHEYLLSEIEFHRGNLYGEPEDAYEALKSVEEEFYDKFIQELTHEHH